MRYASMRSLDISNGEGVGISLFTQGCRFRCYNCFNPMTWDVNSGNEWNEEAENKLLKLLNRDFIKRITFLGGEPLLDKNLSEIKELISKISVEYNNKTIWIYSGYTWEEIFNSNSSEMKIRQEILKYCDVLVDGRYIDELRDVNLKWRGSSNQRVIDVQQSLKEGKVILYTD